MLLRQLIAYLEGLGCTLLGHFGLRNIVDYLTDNESKFNPNYFAELEEIGVRYDGSVPLLPAGAHVPDHRTKMKILQATHKDIGALAVLNKTPDRG